MPGFSDVEVTTGAKQDLRTIGGKTEKNLIGQLFRLGEAERRGETRSLEWQKEGAPTRKCWRIGSFAVVYHEQSDGTGRRVAVIEAVVLERYLDDWLKTESAEAKRRDDAIAAQEQASGGSGPAK